MPVPASLALTSPGDDLLCNPAPRLPIAVILDTSGSMAGRPLEELQEALARFLDELAGDADASASADLAVITVGGDVAVQRPFALAASGGVPALEADGATPLGAGIGAALRLLDERKTQYRAAGTPYYQPWLVVLTDGAATDDTARARSQTARLVRERKLTVFPVGVGPHADLDQLQALAGGVRPMRLQGLAFGAFFRWLSASVACASRSTPGQGVALPSPFTWVEL